MKRLPGWIGWSGFGAGKDYSGYYRKAFDTAGISYRYLDVDQAFFPGLNDLFRYRAVVMFTGDRSKMGELVAPRSSELRPFDVPGNRDFNARSFRSNVVLRWEWKPGSTLFVVWQQNRAETDPVGTRASVGDMFNSIRAPGDHVLAVKTTFCPLIDGFG